MKVALIGTGTAGHVYCALSLGRSLQQHGHEVSFLGGEIGPETQLLADEGISLHTLPSRPFFGVGIFGRVRAGFCLLASVGVAYGHLKKLNVDLVMGFGGHVSVAYVLAARILGISTAIHEANTQPGLGNRMLKPIVDRIYLGQLACESYFKGPKSKCVGFPVRPALLHGRNHLPDPQEPIRILVLGGSHGADFLNRNTANLVASLQNAGLEIAVIHQAGEAGTEVAKAAYRAIGVSAKVVGYSHDIGELYSQADFAISSAGAGTLAELSIWGLPCLLVPLAAASENHQEANARYFAEKTGCLTVTETQWESETLTDSLKALLTDAQRYESLSLAIKRVAKPDAAAVLANEIQEWLSSDEFNAKAAIRPGQH